MHFSKLPIWYDPLLFVDRRRYLQLSKNIGIEI